MKKRVLLEDIAREVGVTKGLVSRALAGKYNVSDEMRDRITQKAVEMGYDFSKLKSKKPDATKCSLIISKRILLKEDYWQPIIRSVSSTLDRYNILLEYQIYDEEDLNKMFVDKLRRLKTNAFIIMHENPLIIANGFKDIKKPVVVIDPKYFHNDEFLQMKFSNYESIYLATRCLIENGHKRIAFYGCDEHAISFRERHEGFLAAVSVYRNQDVKGYDILFDNTYLQYGDHELLKSVINDKEKKISAIVCANDIIALNVYKAARELGINIPEELSVIGFDDIKEGEYANPPLTTFKVPRHEIGVEVGRYLINCFQNQQLLYNQVIIRCDFIERESVKKLKKGDPHDQNC
ncbi:MAG: LacI family DNA-binding transcriptional regulator [Bacilli bacterium]|jgi:LacI family transcriptional regulator|nr:LacI family transcriptional regulator [Erysipelotrichia bacterium]